MVQQKVMLTSGLVAACFVFCNAQFASATMLAAWTFETNTPSDLPNSSTGPTVAAETGTGSLAGFHTSALTDWSTPSGNGSSNSYSSNEWAVGDYYQFDTTSTGYEDVMVCLDHTSSNTGPRDFTLSYSTGGSYTDSTSYMVLANATPIAWSPSTNFPEHRYCFDLSSVTALDDQATISFRVSVNSTTSANGGTVATAGTSRVDNVDVSATLIPEPILAICIIPWGFLVAIRRNRQLQ
jgi:hypothetical protein